MKNKLYFFLSAILICLVLTNLTSAWIVPETHDWIAHQAIAQAPTSEVSQLIQEHFDDFSACMSLTDYSVFFYFQQGFSTIGKVYLASHNNLICPRAIELADKSNPSEMACAYGVCSMDFEDSPSHNGYVPMVIERTGLVNGLIHAPAEECVNKKITTPELVAEGRSALVNKYPEHRAFLIKVFQSDSRATTVDVGLMMDAFVSEVASSNQYTVGFRGFTAVPTSIHIILLLYFLFGMVTITFLIRKQNKTKFNKISMLLVILFVIIPVILVYVLYFTGNIWKAFQVATTPLCWVLPTSGYETYLQQAISNEINLFNNGATASYQLPDPAGLNALHNADAGNVWKLWVVGIFLIFFIILFIWLNFRAKRKK